MAFIPVTSTEIDTGKPTSTQLAEKIKDNLDDHEARLQSVESGGAVTYPCAILRIGGFYSIFGGRTNFLKTTTNFDLQITGVRLYIDRAGTAGTTTADIKVLSGGVYTSIFTTLPSVAFGAGNDAVSSNAVLDATKVNIAAGSIIRVDLTTVQTGGVTCWLRVDYLKT